MGLNADLAGKDYGSKTYKVTAEAIEKFARATNDLNERYLSADVVASPIFPIVPAFDSFMAAAMDPDLEADLLRLVHGAEEHVLYEAIQPGDTLTISTILESVDKKDTGETFTVKSTETNQHGTPVAEVRGTMFIRGSGSGPRPAAAQSDEAERSIEHEVTAKVDEDQTHRYAEASGDHNPIHLDEATARMAGLPGIIVHGMCTMALATQGAVDGLAGGDPSRVRRVAVRFSKPVRPGQELTTKFWPEAGAGAATTYGFETYNSDGIAVIKAGIVEVES